jgi:hypothetical protein
LIFGVDRLIFGPSTSACRFDGGPRVIGLE